MNNEQIKGDAKIIKGKLKEAFAKLTDNDLMLYEGKRDQFVGQVVKVQGIAKEDAEKKIKAIEDSSAADSASKAKVA